MVLQEKSDECARLEGAFGYGSGPDASASGSEGSKAHESTEEEATLRPIHEWQPSE
ncbi:MAG: hypothetical protein OJF47_002661 [Nitrospira sp.]|nr:MAG: hypothetical protein OJF47_002661 [Nitrospira sp.]